MTLKKGYSRNLSIVKGRAGKGNHLKQEINMVREGRCW